MKNKQFIYTEKDAEKMFFTSDTHFCHSNIIKYCKRPFANIAENDEEIIPEKIKTTMQKTCIIILTHQQFLLKN